MDKKYFLYGKQNKMNMNSLLILLKKKINSVILLKKSQLLKNHNNYGHMHILDITMEISNIILNGQIAKKKNNLKVGML